MSTTFALYITLAACVLLYFMLSKVMKTVSIKNKEISALRNEIARLKVVHDVGEDQL